LEVKKQLAHVEIREGRQRSGAGAFDVHVVGPEQYLSPPTSSRVTREKGPTVILTGHGVKVVRERIHRKTRRSARVAGGDVQTRQ